MMSSLIRSTSHMCTVNPFDGHDVIQGRKTAIDADYSVSASSFLGEFVAALELHCETDHGPDGIPVWMRVVGLKYNFGRNDRNSGRFLRTEVSVHINERLLLDCVRLSAPSRG